MGISFYLQQVIQADVCVQSDLEAFYIWGQTEDKHLAEGRAWGLSCRPANWQTSAQPTTLEPPLLHFLFSMLNWRPNKNNPVMIQCFW